jgi:hypothetical protein
MVAPKAVAISHILIGLVSWQWWHLPVMALSALWWCTIIMCRTASHYRKTLLCDRALPQYVFQSLYQVPSVLIQAIFIYTVICKTWKLSEHEMFPILNVRYHRHAKLTCCEISPRIHAYSFIESWTNSAAKVSCFTSFLHSPDPLTSFQDFMYRSWSTLVLPHCVLLTADWTIKYILIICLYPTFHDIVLCVSSIQQGTK